MSKSPLITLQTRDESEQLSERRNSFATYLTQLISNTVAPAVIGVDASYGSGKTFFAERWKQKLKDNSFTVESIDCWRTDYTEDPLIPLTDAIAKTQPAAQVAAKLHQIAASLMVKSTTALIKVGAELVTPGASTVAAYPLDTLATHLTQTPSAENRFKELLGKVRLAAAGKPIIIILDELDRCRPTYAIRLLERIKHYFSEEGFIFVAFYDQAPLRAAVRQLYGADINSAAYLHKFFDLQMKLPPITTREVAGAFVARFRTDELLKERFQYTRENTYTVVDAIEQAANVMQLSARDIHHILGKFLAILYNYEVEDTIPTAALIYLLAIERAEPTLFDELSRGHPLQKLVDAARGWANYPTAWEQGIGAQIWIELVALFPPTSEYGTTIARVRQGDPLTPFDKQLVATELARYRKSNVWNAGLHAIDLIKHGRGFTGPWSSLSA